MAAAVTEQVPVLSVRHAHGGCIFAGFYRPGKDPDLRHGVVDVVVPALVGDADKVSLAGPPRDDVLAALAATETSVVGTGIEYPDVRVLQKMCTAALSDPRRLVDLASPMTETSAVFGDARTTLSRK
jgi:hypothetical protein